MVKSRLDLYRAGDEAIDNDPAYEDYPDVSLQPDIEAQGPRPMVEELPDFLKKFYGQPGGFPDLADLVQGVSRRILPVQEAITPGSSVEDRERYRQLYELEEAMAKRASQQLGTEDYTGRYGAGQKAKDIEAITGDRQTSGLGMGVREALGPQVETVTELAEGKPFYELTPMQMTDAAFAVIDTIDVFGLTELARRGLTAGAKALAEKIANATTRQEKIDIAVQDSRGLMLLNEELNRIKTKATGEPNDDMLPSSMIDGERVANLTGKRAFDDKRVEATKQFYDKAFDERVDSINTAAKKRLKELGKDKFSQKDFDLFLQELYPDLTRQQIYNLRRGVRESQGKYYTTQPFTELFNAPTEEGLIDFFSKNEGKVFDKNKFYEDYGITTSTLGNFLKKNPSYNKFFDQAGKKSLISNTSQIDQVRKNNKLVDDRFNQLEDFLKTQDNPNFYLESLRKKFKLDDLDPETNKQIITENNFRKYMKEQGYESKKNVLDNEDALKILRKYGLAASKTDSGLAGRYLELMFRSITDSPAEVMKNFEKKYGFKIKESKTDKVTRDNNLKAFEKFIEDENVLDKFFGDANNFEQFAMLAKEVDAANVALFDHLDKLYRRSKSENGNFHKAINKFISRFKSPRKDINRFFNTLRLELSHEFEIAKALEMDRLEGAGFDVSTIYPSYGSFNRGLQKKREKQIRDKIFKVFSKDRSETLSTDLSEKSLQAGAQLRDIAQELDKLGITSIIPIDDPNIKNVVQNFIIRDNQGKSASSFDIFFDPKKGTGELIIGRGANEGMRGKPFSVQALKENMINRLNELYNNPEMIKSYKSELENLPKSTLLKGAIKPYSKGGPVKMAIGGDPLENLNQQQFSADPAFEGEDYFSQAVESGNLQAFNPIRLFNIFGKSKGVVTPKDIEPTMLPSPGATDELTPAPISPVERNDFPFQSFTLEKMMSPNAPNAAKPQAWADFLMGGQQAPLSEIRDSGLEQFLRDYEKFFPDEKVTRQQLIDYYQESPIGNLNVIIKNENPRSIAEADELTPDQQDFVRYGNAMGLPKHKNVGSQPLDEVGKNYRNVIVQAGSIPGESRAFVESGHFDDPNIIAFTRVADYAGPDGQNIAVIQELQTDMLTSLRKEQERIDAMLKRLDKAEQKLRIEAQSTDPYVSANAINRLEELNSMMSTQQKEILKETKGIKPFPNAAGKGLIPRYSEQLTGLQKLIDDEMKARVAQDMPYVDEKIFDISQQQLKIRDDLLDLNRALELDSLLKDIRVPSGRTSEDIARFGEESGVPQRYDTKELKLFGSVPFQKQKDYVDLILKATIKDAQSKGIEKVGIYPGKLVTQRWNKDIDGPEGKKFKDLYDRVAIQQMKSIAKKYGGTVDLEKIINPNLSDRGLTYYKRNLDGEYEYLKQDQLAQGLEPEEAQLFIDEQLNRNAHTLGDKQVIYTKEIAPGQTMDYYVDPYVVTEGEESIKKYNLVPLGPGDDRNAAQVLIEEYNPQEILIPVLTLPKTEKSAKPFFLYGKKDGGKISNDGLISITDIYGDY